MRVDHRFVVEKADVAGEGAEWERTAEWLQERRKKARRRVLKLAEEMGRSSIEAIAEVPAEAFGG